MGGGGKGGGGAYTPTIHANDLHTTQEIKVLDLLSEGPIRGWKHPEEPLKDIYFQETPVLSEAGTVNFKGVEVAFTDGSLDQSYLPNFDTVERIVQVQAKVKHENPIVRTVTNSNVTSLRLAIGVESLTENTDKGDSLRTSVQMRVELVKDGVSRVTRDWFKTGKTDKPYLEDMTLTNLPEVPFQIRVSRITADSKSEYLRNDTIFPNYVEIIDTKLSYPYSSVVGVKVNAELFGNSIPERTYQVMGKIVQIPSNYDPDKRTYEGFWDGEFKAGWTNNPAWVLYDLITNKRYGLGRRMEGFEVDKWALYRIANYCDELVDDGFGGQEPRFVCNAYLHSPKQAHELFSDIASCFRGMAVWDGNQFTAVSDLPRDPVAVYTNANVIEGKFTYTGSDFKSIFSAVHVEYVDALDSYRSKVEYVSNDFAILDEGLNITKVVAFGATSRGQAVRQGRWILESNRRERLHIAFGVGKEGLLVKPFDIITVADNDYIGKMSGGRVLEYFENYLNVIRIDREIDRNAFVGSTFAVTGLDGKIQEFKITDVIQDRIYLDKNIEVAPYAAWVAKPLNVQLRQYRVVSVTENEEGTYSIGAVQHSEDKQSAVDDTKYPWEDNGSGTIEFLKPEVFNFMSRLNVNQILLTWQVINPASEKTSFRIELHKQKDDDSGDFELYTNYLTDQTQYVISSLPPAVYRATLVAQSDNGKVSDPVTIGFSTAYEVTNLTIKPQLFSYEVNWSIPTMILGDAFTEVWVSDVEDFKKANRVAKIPVPQTFYLQGGMGIESKNFVWVRIADNDLNQGNLVGPVVAVANTDPNDILDYLDGQIKEDQLSKELLDQINSGGTAGDAAAEALAKANESLAATKQEVEDRKAAINKEISDRNAAIKKETDARLADIKKLNDGLTQEIVDRKAGDSNLQGQITTIKASTDKNTAAIQTEITARTDADTALGKRIDLVIADNGVNTAAIKTETEARVAADSALGKRIDSTNVQVGKNTANILTVTEAQADFEKSTTTKLETISSSIGGKGTNLMHLNQSIMSTKTKVSKDSRSTVTLNDGYVHAHLETGGYVFLTRSFYVSDNAAKVEKGKSYLASATITAETDCVVRFRLSGLARSYNNAAGNTTTSFKAGETKRIISYWEEITMDEEFINLSFWSTDTTPPEKFRISNAMLEEIPKGHRTPSTFVQGSGDVLEQIGFVSADITDYKKTQADINKATAEQLNTMNVQVNKNKSDITVVTKAQADFEKSTAEKFENLAANFDGVVGAVAFGRQMDTKFVKTGGSNNSFGTVVGDDFVIGDGKLAESWVGEMLQKFPLVKGAAYKMTYKFRKDITNDDQTILGFCGYKKDKVTRQNSAGANSASQQYYFNSAVRPVGEHEVVGFAVYDKADYDALKKLDPKSFVIAPPEGVAYVAPQIWFNYNNKAGKSSIHEVSVEAVDVNTMAGLGAASAEISDFKKTQADTNKALTEQINSSKSEFTKRIDDIQAIGGNLIDDSEFINGLDNWFKPTNFAYGINMTPLRTIEGANVAYITANTGVAGTGAIIQSQSIAIDRNKVYQLSAWVARGGSFPTAGIYARFLDSSGAFTANDMKVVTVSSTTSGNTDDLTNMVRVVINVKSKTDTATVLRLAFNFANRADTSVGYGWMVRPQVVEVPSMDTPEQPYLVGSNREQLKSTKAEITDLRTTQATDKAALSQQINTVSAKVDNIVVGGRNLIPQKTIRTWGAAGNLPASKVDKYNVKLVRTTGNLGVITTPNVTDLTKGDPVIFSFKIRLNSGTIQKVAGHSQIIDLSNQTLYMDGVKMAGNLHNAAGTATKLTIGKTVQVVVTGTYDPNVTDKNLYVQPNRPDFNANYDCDIWDIQFERGNVVSDWTPSPEDGADTSALEAKVTQNTTAIAEIDGKVQATWSLKVETKKDGKKVVGGIALGSSPQGSTFIVQADKFAVYDSAERPMFIITGGKAGLNADLIVNGSILGEHIKANQTIQAPIIQGGSLDIGGGRFKVDNQGRMTLKADPAKNVGMQITNERIDVYDETGKLRVRLGKLN